MTFRTELRLPQSVNLINHRNRICTLGSCFATHMQGRLQKYKFMCNPNPFGVIFHPISIAKLIQYTLDDRKFNENDLHFSQGVYVHTDFHSMFSAPDPNIVLENIHLSLKSFKNQLINLDYLFITLGTSIGYRLKSDDQIVANCHKMPADLFVQYEASLDELMVGFDPLIQILTTGYPELKIIFTVSPVRHIRHGIVENSRSKAKLILLEDMLVQKYTNLSYFPAYEWMIDDLRDYRFYEKDLIHPNEQGVDYIWEKFKDHFFSEETIHLLRDLDNIIHACAHRPFNPSTREHHQFCIQTLHKIEVIQNKHPMIDFTEETEKLRNVIETS